MKLINYKNSPPRNPKGPNSGSGRVLRGGGWVNFEGDLRCANRGSDEPSSGSDDFGCRLRQDI